MRNGNQVLTCPKGHVTEVLNWGTVPLACPHCVHGLPCQMPLTPVRQKVKR